MRSLLNCRLLWIALLLPFALFAEEEAESFDHPIADEMLIKPSIIDLGDLSEDSEQFESSADEQLKEIQPAPSFLDNLQANLGGMSMPVAPTNGDGQNTWVPKFVWIGDVKQSDDLKCFAAFLIGSLADKGQASQTSPGVFMTPVTTPSATSAQNTAALPALSTKEMTARTTPRSSTPPPTPAASKFFSEIDFGLGFLYFAKVKGNLRTLPNEIYANVNGSAGGGNPSKVIRGHIQYNRTPIYTVDFGWNLSDWAAFSCTMQSQQGVFIRTQPFQFAYTSNNFGGPTLVTSNFEGNLDLYSVGGKLMFRWPNMVNYSNWTMSLYIGGSGAGGWQSWTRLQATQTVWDDNVQNMVSANITFRNQYYANFSYTGDAGLLFKPTNIFAKMTFKMGCKFIGWGSTRGLGAVKDQNDIFNDGTTAGGGNVSFSGKVRPGYFKPIRIGTIYSWAPYVGFNWDF